MLGRQKGSFCRWDLLLKGGVIVAVCTLDLVVKAWVRAEVAPYSNTPLIPHFITLTHVSNYGISFSLLSGLPTGIRTPLLSVIAMGVMLLLCWVWWSGRTQMHALQHWGFVLVMGGALSNVIDRIHRGAVTDYFHFHFYTYSFFINNLADIFISIGVVGYLTGMFLVPKEQAT